MPKVVANYPVSGLFGVVKPSGPTSMSVVHDLQQLIARSKLFVTADKLEEIKNRKPNNKRRGKQAREAIKVGQGGTLDPLADGVLVIGVGKGTKKLSDFLNCTKEYETTCLLGCDTDTYDSEGSKVQMAPWHHVTPELIKATLSQFTGEINQTPPIFSALKMDGKPLYEYARKGIPLPRPIEPRKVTVHSLELVEWKGNNHSYQWPEKSLSEDDKKAMEVTLKSLDQSVEIKDRPEIPSDDESPPAFVLRMRVSGGTYVRSIVHDLSRAIGSAGHVVTLSRTRQGRFVSTPTEEGDKACVPWEIFEKASATNGDEVDAEGWTEWEREVMERLEVVEERGSK
ncbi:pseudouridylate synthase 4 [Coprinopsis marcescibilis]|uniref:tRNA pseudouridine(55) synthase n=1 Tax=Coprinopsis marcescibilis TaxID=230819 RepID=A0A5C3LBI0_COPMA|nr:pseudouridylate synthase 4 [Coprinopsis marcescibilis]